MSKRGGGVGMSSGNEPFWLPIPRRTPMLVVWTVQTGIAATQFVLNEGGDEDTWVAAFTASVALMGIIAMIMTWRGRVRFSPWGIEPKHRWFLGGRKIGWDEVTSIASPRQRFSNVLEVGTRSEERAVSGRPNAEQLERVHWWHGAASVSG